MPHPIATGELRRRILIGAGIYGIFFGLMPPYVMMIVVVSTWGMPPLEPPDEQTFRAVYLLRLVLGNIVGLGMGALTAFYATHIGLKIAGKATYPRAIVGGALLGAPVGAITAGSTPLMLLISSTDVEWATQMIRRTLAVGGLMGLVNGVFAAIAIVYIIRMAGQKAGDSTASS